MFDWFFSAKEEICKAPGGTAGSTSEEIRKAIALARSRCAEAQVPARAHAHEDRKAQLGDDKKHQEDVVLRGDAG